MINSDQVSDGKGRAVLDALVDWVARLGAEPAGEAAMTFSPQRRSLMLAALAAPLAGCALAAPRDESFARELARLETNPADGSAWPRSTPAARSS